MQFIIDDYSNQTSLQLRMKYSKVFNDYQRICFKNNNQKLVDTFIYAKSREFIVAISLGGAYVLLNYSDLGVSINGTVLYLSSISYSSELLRKICRHFEVDIGDFVFVLLLANISDTRGMHGICIYISY